MEAKTKPENFPPLLQQPVAHRWGPPEAPVSKPKNRRGWESEWNPVDDSELEQLEDREDPV